VTSTLPGMRGVPRRNWFGASIAAALLLLFAAGLLWLGALVIAKGTDCPEGTRHRLMGLEQPISVWPPGAVCYPKGAPAGDEHVEEAPPPLKWAILALALGAPLTLIAGAVSEVTDQRAARRAGRRRAPPGFRTTQLG
jgi:hypothetical protein